MKISHSGAVLLALVLVGCSPSGDKSEVPESERPTVCVSNYPLGYFVERITTPVVEVSFPVPGGIDPAYWKPTAEDVLALQRADLILINGASYESWLKNASLPQSKLVDTSAGLQERLISLSGVTTHSHGLEGEHEHAETAFTTWLDLSLAVEQARAAKEALAERWPRHKDQFEAQFDLLARELISMDSRIKEVVASNPGLPVVFSHPVFQYLEVRYGLNGRSLHWEPGQMPDREQKEAFTSLLKEFPAGWMIWEGDPDRQIVDWLETLGVRSATFLPCGNQPEEGDFQEVWERNIAELQRIFGSAPNPQRP